MGRGFGVAVGGWLLATSAAAPGPPPASPAPFRIYFDWDGATLSPRARAVLASAASRREPGITRIEVDGYTDPTSQAAYAQSLSRRRFASVRAELLRDGVPNSAIAMRRGRSTQPPSDAFARTILLTP